MTQRVVAGAPAVATRQPALSPSDPAVQVVESAYQIITMIGANPRAIRPILAQRRLTAADVLSAASATSDRVATALTELDQLAESRRAAYEADVAEVQGFLASATAADAPRHEEHIEAATSAWQRFQKNEQSRRQYLTTLRDRAARVSEVYQALA
jgi:hypothetical protein